MAEGAVGALGLGQADGVFLDAVQHAGVAGAQIIFGEKEVSIGQKPDVVSTPVGGDAVLLVELGGGEPAGVGLQAGLDFIIVGIAGGDRREQGQAGDGVDVRHGVHLALGLHQVRGIGQHLGDEMIAGLGEDFRGFRAVKRQCVGIGTEGF